MFNQVIRSPISPLTNTYVNGLVRVRDEPDYSLTCLAVALIKPRVANFAGIEGAYKYHSCISSVESRITSTIQSRLQLGKEYTDNTPCFSYNIVNMSDAGAAEIKAWAKEQGLTELTVVENFVKQQLGITTYCVFINSENNSTFVVVSGTMMSLYHLTISFISLFYPALFKENPINKQEMEILKSLTNKTAGNFTERISRALQYMKEDLIRGELTQLFKSFRQTRIDQCKYEMDQMNETIEQILQNYRNRVEAYEQLVIRYEGLQVMNENERNQEEQETIDYISSCPRIHEINYSDSALSFCVDTLLTNFDLAKWKNAVRRSNIYNQYRVSDDSIFKDQKNRVMLFNQIFTAKPLLYVKMRGHIELYMRSCDMTAPRGQTCAENCYELKDYITNPHFKLHGCPGRNKEQIIRCLRQGDVVSAIECAIAATGSVNIDETEYTFRPFLLEVLNSKDKILQNNKGEDMTPEEAVLWLSKQNLPEPENKNEDDEPVLNF